MENYTPPERKIKYKNGGGAAEVTLQTQCIKPPTSVIHRTAGEAGIHGKMVDNNF